MDSEIMLGETPARMQQTMAISRETVADSQERLGDTGVLLREWIEWCESTGRAAHAAELIERSRASMRNS